MRQSQQCFPLLSCLKCNKLDLIRTNKIVIINITLDDELTYVLPRQPVSVMVGEHPDRD